ELLERFVVAADLLALGGETVGGLVLLARLVELSETLRGHGQVVVDARVVGIGGEDLVPTERRLTPQSSLRRLGAEAHVLLEAIMPRRRGKDGSEKSEAQEPQKLRSHGRAPVLPS